MTDTDIIRVELGLEVEPGRWRYSAPAYGVEGCLHQPLLDACRQIKSLWPETLSQQGQGQAGAALHGRGWCRQDDFGKQQPRAVLRQVRAVRPG